MRKSLGLAGIIQGINDLLLRFATSDSRKGTKVEFSSVQSTTEMKNRIDVLDLDMLSMYGQDDLLQ